MSLTIDQISAVSYPAVLAEMRKAENQWAENAALRALEKHGCIQRIDFGDGIETPLDYRANPDAAVLASDMDNAALTKTDIYTAASYAIAQLSVPVVWSKGDDAKTPDANSKIRFVQGLLENGITSHDQLIEQAVFVTTAAGGDELLGLDTLVPNNGQGTPGGIAASTEAWWQNWSDTYTDETDIEATMTEAFNEASKGSGSGLTPKFLLMGSTPYTLYESQLQTLQRFNDTSEADGGFKVLKFKTADMIWSQYGADEIYFLNNKNYKLLVSRSYFRDKGATQEINDQNAFRFFIYSALQFVTNNKSRLAVVYQA